MNLQPTLQTHTVFSLAKILKSTPVAQVRAKNKIKTVRLAFPSRENMWGVNFKSNQRAYVCLLSIKMPEIPPILDFKSRCAFHFN